MFVKQTTLSSSYGDLKGVLDSLSNGTYTIEVTATDEAGNSITKHKQLLFHQQLRYCKTNSRNYR